MPTQRRSASSPRATSRSTEGEAPSGTRAAKKTAAKKATAKKSTAKKSTTKSAARKSATKGTAARSTPPEGRTASPARARSDETSSREPDQEREQPRAQAREPERRSSRPSAREVATFVADELEDLTGKEPESIVRLGRDDDGWVVGIEVVESRRIPDSTDILAVYEVHADDDGSLRSYERTRRYTRGRTVDE
ncbi:MAG: gas vesicle protein GvpO [Oryzihumus sp.]